MIHQHERSGRERDPRRDSESGPSDRSDHAENRPIDGANPYGQHLLAHPWKDFDRENNQSPLDDVGRQEDGYFPSEREKPSDSS
jgi:hypothetical protein